MKQHTPTPTESNDIQRELMDAMSAAALNQALALHQSAARPAAILIGSGLAINGTTSFPSAVFLMPDVCGRALIVIENPRAWPGLRRWLRGMDYDEEPATRWRNRRALVLQGWTETIIANSDGLPDFAGYWQFISVQRAAADAACAVFARHGVECHAVTEKD